MSPSREPPLVASTWTTKDILPRSLAPHGFSAPASTLERQLLVLAVFDSGLDCDEWLHRNPSFPALGWRSETRRAACPRPARNGPRVASLTTRVSPPEDEPRQRSSRRCERVARPVVVRPLAMSPPRASGPVRRTHGDQQASGCASAGVLQVQSPRIGSSPRPSPPPPKRRAARPAGGARVPSDPSAEAAGRQGSRAIRSTRVLAASSGRKSGPPRPLGCRRSPPRAAAGRSQLRCGASLSDASRAAEATRDSLDDALHHPPGRRRRLRRPLSSVLPDLGQSHPRDTVAALHNRGRGRFTGGSAEASPPSPGPFHGVCGRSERTGAHGARH
jgi:hypothetical protein